MDLYVTRTYGILATDGVESVTGLFTIELPWANNEPDKSCAPAAKYALIPYNSPTHGPTWCLHNPDENIYATPDMVPSGTVGARTNLELHSANWARQLLGCVAFGDGDKPMLDPVTGIVEPAVESSVDAINKLHALLGVGTYGHTITFGPQPS